VDSYYYSESELCGDVVTVSILKYLLCQAIALLSTLHPLPENVLQTVCRKLQEDSGTGGFLPLSSFFHGLQSPEIAWGEI
jgi:hypothetical protein